MSTATKMPKRKRKGKPKLPPGVKRWLLWVADDHVKYLDYIARHHELTTKAAALRMAVANELLRGPVTEQLRDPGAITTRWCVDRSREDRANTAQIMKLRHLRHESDATRLAIEREYAACKAAKKQTS